MAQSNRPAFLQTCIWASRHLGQWRKYPPWFSEPPSRGPFETGSRVQAIKAGPSGPLVLALSASRGTARPDERGGDEPQGRGHGFWWDPSSLDILATLEQKKNDNISGGWMRDIANIRTCEARTQVSVPVFLCKVPAGFPSPADDHLDHPLDFNELLIAHPAATFAVRVSGDSMTGIGIFPGDIAVIDRALDAVDGSIVLGVLDGDFTIKRYRRKGRGVWLEAANPAYKPIPITEDRAFEIWGVVRYAIRTL